MRGKSEDEVALVGGGRWGCIVNGLKAEEEEEEEEASHGGSGESEFEDDAIWFWVLKFIVG